MYLTKMAPAWENIWGKKKNIGTSLFTTMEQLDKSLV
jgi:hypothetical protein